MSLPLTTEGEKKNAHTSSHFLIITALPTCVLKHTAQRQTDRPTSQKLPHADIYTDKDTFENNLWILDTHQVTGSYPSPRWCDFLRLVLKSFTSDEQQSRLCRWCVCVCVCVWVCVCMRGGECALVCDWGACESRGGQRQSDVVMERFKGCRDFSALSLPPSPLLAASGMHFSWVSSPQLRSDCWSSLSLSLSLCLHPSSFSLPVSLTHTETHPPSHSSLSLSLSLCLPTLSCCADRSGTSPFSGSWKQVFSSVAPSLYQIFTSYFSLCATFPKWHRGRPWRKTNRDKHTEYALCMLVYLHTSL